MNIIPYGRQDINQDDIDAVISVLKSDFLTQGNLVPKFSEVVSNYCRAKYALALNSATSALHGACLSLGVKNGDVVWTTPNTFVASANCALCCGASIDFIDINAKTYNIDIEKLEEKLIFAEKNGNLPKVLIPVHFAGQSCDMESIYKLSVKYGFKIIEDASHAIGGKYKNEAIGNCRFSDITVFSFHPVKIITTGEGGMVLTNNPELAHLMSLFGSHGTTSIKDFMEPRPEDEIWNYQQVELGHNFRMTDIQAALGLSQMNRLDEFVSKRQEIAQKYYHLLNDLPIKTPWQHPDTYSSFHLFVARLDLNASSKTQKNVFQELKRSNILANLHYIPVYLHPYYEKLGFRRGYCPEAENYYREAISLPIYSSLNEEQQLFVINKLQSILSG